MYKFAALKKQENKKEGFFTNVRAPYAATTLGAAGGYTKTMREMDVVLDSQLYNSLAKKKPDLLHAAMDWPGVKAKFPEVAAEYQKEVLTKSRAATLRGMASKKTLAKNILGGAALGALASVVEQKIDRRK